MRSLGPKRTKIHSPSFVWLPQAVWCCLHMDALLGGVRVQQARVFCCLLQDFHYNMKITSIQMYQTVIVFLDLLNIFLCRDKLWCHARRIQTSRNEHSYHVKDIYKALLAHSLGLLNSMFLSKSCLKKFRISYLISPEVSFSVVVVGEVWVSNRIPFTHSFSKMLRKFWLHSSPEIFMRHFFGEFDASREDVLLV